LAGELREVPYREGKRALALRGGLMKMLIDKNTSPHGWIAGLNILRDNLFFLKPPHSYADNLFGCLELAGLARRDFL